MRSMLLALLQASPALQGKPAEPDSVAFGTRYYFSKILLTPVTGQGKKLR